MKLGDFANDSPPSSRMGSLDNYVQPEVTVAPIDMYRATTGSIINYGTRERLQKNTFLGRLSILGLVSAAEGYIRWVLSNCIEICPLSQSNAASKSINLGGLLWHGQSGFSRSAFEHASFASKTEIVKVFSDFLCFKLEDSKFKTLLDEFDKICHLRHGIAHGDGFMPGRNAVQLDIRRYGEPLRITVGFPQLQETAAVINTLIYTLNRELFVEMCRRWAISWRKRADWNNSKEIELFDAIFGIFHSRGRLDGSEADVTLTKAACMQEARAMFTL